MLGKIIMVLVILMVIAGALVISTNKYDLSTGEGRMSFAKTYFGWIGHTVKNIYSVTAYAIKLDWVPKTG
jgi:hypothetical protein